MSKYCIVITAAGQCKRMGAFKPLLPIKNDPVIVHMLNNYFDAGISHAVIVTGRQAEDLQAACRTFSNITFIHNPNYASTEMYDSIRLGLSAVPEDCDRILFTPVDTPFVSQQSIKTVMAQTGDLVFPSYDFHRGHPLMLNAAHIPALLQYKGLKGLRGALASLELTPAYAQVDDPFVLTDMDTPEVYRSLLQQFESTDTH